MPKAPSRLQASRWGLPWDAGHHTADVETEVPRPDHAEDFLQAGCGKAPSQISLTTQDFSRALVLSSNLGHILRHFVFAFWQWKHTFALDAASSLSLRALAWKVSPAQARPLCVSACLASAESSVLPPSPRGTLTQKEPVRSRLKPFETLSHCGHLENDLPVLNSQKEILPNQVWIAKGDDCWNIKAFWGERKSKGVFGGKNM